MRIFSVDLTSGFAGRFEFLLVYQTLGEDGAAVFSCRRRRRRRFHFGAFYGYVADEVICIVIEFMYGMLIGCLF